jgi:hypothetical protein
MLRTIERRLAKAEQLVGVHQPLLDLAALVELKPFSFYIKNRKSSAVFFILTNGLKGEHAALIASAMDLGRWGPLPHYVLTWAHGHSWCAESFGAMGPFVIPEKLADWLAALPDTALGFKPGDVCWECACFYPYYSQRRPDGSFLDRHPWVGRACLLCGAKIAPRYHDSLSFGLTNKQVENAPYVRKRKEMESVWAEQVREADRQLEAAAAQLLASAATTGLPLASSQDIKA